MITVEQGKPADARGMQEVFYRTWLATYPNEEAGITKDDVEDRFSERFSAETIAKRAERLANPVPGERYLFAKEGNKVVGVCRVEKREDKNEITALYVLPEYQRNGIGNLLWEEAAKFIDIGKDTFVNVATFNEKGISFYEKLGFVDTGERLSGENFKMKSGALLPQVRLVLKKAD